LVDAWSAIEEAHLTYIRLNQHAVTDEEEYIGTGDEEPIEDVRLPSTFIHWLCYTIELGETRGGFSLAKAKI
jgi:hypothetical protein